MESVKHAYRAVAHQGSRDALILEHLGLVRHISGKLAAQLPPGTDLENLESAGVLGLVEAANHFDHDRGAQFKTFAYIRIRGAILDELRRNCPLPQQMLQMVAQVRKAHAELRSPVSVADLVAATGLTEGEVQDSLAAIRMTRHISLNAPGESLGARLQERAQRPDAAIEREEQRSLLVAALQSLAERERLVVTLYYLEDLRLKEIAQVLDLSESRVSRVLNSALFHLGEYLQAHESKEASRETKHDG